MAQIKNIEGLTVQDIQREVEFGGKFVIFEFTISVIFMTFKNPTSIYFIRSGESHWSKSLPYTFLTLLLGWWGFPWGIIYTPMALITNLSGGKDVTNEVMQSIGRPVYN